MSWSFSLGRLFGSELRVHVTFFLLLAWIGWSAFADAAGQRQFKTSCSFLPCLLVSPHMNSAMLWQRADMASEHQT